jgi:hypothetical protein
MHMLSFKSIYHTALHKPTTHTSPHTLFAHFILFFALYSLLLSPNLLYAQSAVTVAGQDVSLRIGGTFQPRFSVGQDQDPEYHRIGFGVRRLRFRTYVGIGSNLQFFTQLEGSGTSAGFVDIRVDYKLSPELTLRAGRFAGAQPRSMALTLHGDIDGIDRIAIAEQWTRFNTGTDARDYGLELVWKPNRLEYRLFVHNGSNQLNYRSSINDESATQFATRNELAVSSIVRFFPNNNPNSEIGLFAGHNATGGIGGQWGQPKNSSTLSFHAYHGVFPGHFPYRLKTDVILVKYSDVVNVTNRTVRGDQIFTGFSAFAGYLVRPDTELYVHAETFNRSNLGTASNRVSLWQIGLTHSLSKAQNLPFNNHKLTLAYGQRDDSILNQQTKLLQLQLQVYF